MPSRETRGAAGGNGRGLVDLISVIHQAGLLNVSDVHSKLSPSAASRWLACPGSLQFEAGDRSSQYAAAGTVAHVLAHECWVIGVPAKLFLGQPRSVDGFTFVIDEEMVDAVQMYVEFLDSIHNDGAAIAETRIEHSTVPNFGGTLDMCFPAKKRIVDFKYGIGIRVETENNVQLGCYALLFLDHFYQGVIDDVTFKIVQPRATHKDGPIRSWTASIEWLTDLKERIEEVASGVRDEELHAGSHCQFCPAKQQCPELYELTLLTAKNEFAPHSLDPSKAARILDSADAIRAYLNDVERWVHSTLDKGVEVPGYKLAEAFANRRYAVDTATIERRCKSAGFGKKQIYETTLLSPAQLEKVVGADLIASFVERPCIGTTVAPMLDSRAAVKRLTAAEEFQDAEVI